MKKQKNGEIEFLRFIFAMIIVIHHFSAQFSLNMFTWGRIGVEFFFMVTGVLLAKSAKKTNIERNQIPSYTWASIKRKVAVFLPYYVMALLFQEIIFNILICHDSGSVLVKNFVKAIPRVLLFDSFGFRMRSNFNLGVDWYLSVMVAAIIILLPMLLYNYQWTSKLICPLIGVAGIGFIFHKYGEACAQHNLIYDGMDPLLIRGICDIALGIFGYEVALSIKEWKLTRLSQILLTIFKWCCFILAMVYMYFDIKKLYTFVPMLLLLIGIVLSFSDKTYNISYNKLTMLLGKISLPLFLIHNTIKNIVATLWGENLERWQIYTVIILCPIFAYLFMRFTDFIVKSIKKGKNLFVLADNES